MRQTLGVLLALSAISFTNAVAQVMSAKPQLAQLIVSADEVSANGVFRPDNPTKQNEIIEAETEFTCFHRGGKELVGTDAFCLQATATAPMGMLTASTQWLKVVEWNAAQIIATDDSPICVTQETIFDLKRKTVIALDTRKPEERGLDNACDLLPDRQTYYLQDVVDYYSHKKTASSH